MVRLFGFLLISTFLLQGCAKKECCNCPSNVFGSALDVCEDTPVDPDDPNPNGYSCLWEVLAQALGTDSWEGVEDKLTFVGCDCND